FLAVPAMAVDEFDMGKETEVLLVIEPYVTFDVPSSVTVTVTGGASESVGTPVTAQYWTNVPITVEAKIEPITGSVGTWVCSMWALLPPGQTPWETTSTGMFTAGQGNGLGLNVKVSGVDNMASQTATKDATLTVTISKT
ncbi:unnamed protein product, partial [marine sediment metagenome]